eukprot:TRINITY_DN79911_c0_g1_i1.p1 TRINITY_DN79911_c0_g1~~TRINITY_DN79911_c0_g1_i1.p1  ORF type:complete len:578 (+),score=71.99 TRINITY_DN79911_c0_g1_i1:28-1734(+)
MKITHWLDSAFNGSPDVASSYFKGYDPHAGSHPETSVRMPKFQGLWEPIPLPVVVKPRKVLTLFLCGPEQHDLLPPSSDSQLHSVRCSIGHAGASGHHGVSRTSFTGTAEEATEVVVPDSKAPCDKHKGEHPCAEYANVGKCCCAADHIFSQHEKKCIDASVYENEAPIDKSNKEWLCKAEEGQHVCKEFEQSEEGPKCCCGAGHRWSNNSKQCVDEAIYENEVEIQDVKECHAEKGLHMCMKHDDTGEGETCCCAAGNRFSKGHDRCMQETLYDDETPIQDSDSWTCKVETGTHICKAYDEGSGGPKCCCKWGEQWSKEKEACVGPSIHTNEVAIAGSDPSWTCNPEKEEHTCEAFEESVDGSHDEHHGGPKCCCRAAHRWSKADDRCMENSLYEHEVPVPGSDLSTLCKEDDGTHVCRDYDEGEGGPRCCCTSGHEWNKDDEKCERTSNLTSEGEAVANDSAKSGHGEHQPAEPLEEGCADIKVGAPKCCLCMNGDSMMSLNGECDHCKDVGGIKKCRDVDQSSCVPGAEGWEESSHGEWTEKDDARGQACADSCRHKLLAGAHEA